MKKTLLLTALMLCGAIQLPARQLTPEEALQRANAGRIVPASVAEKPSFTATRNAKTLYYVFDNSNGNGFTIVSADDAAAPILGYSDTGKFDAENIPANMKAFLADYETEIAWAIENGISTYSTTITPMAAKSEIKPLVTTLWDQGSPYNALCPEDSYGRSYTGCVATAIAQIMNYHEWPVKGTGSTSYIPTNIKETQTANFGATTYDWANMADTYTGNETEAQKNAVATLMYHCGVASYMEYSSSASGAGTTDAMMALINNFGYDKSIHYYFRDNYHIGDWENMIYENLANVGPVYYDGENDEGGHAFVCDGYKDGYFHINWGWSGVSNGYFRLSALNPNVQGAGGTSAGYNVGQGILLNIKPDAGGTALPNIVCQGNFNAPPKNETKSASKLIKFSSDSFINYSTFDLTVTPGVKLVSTGGTTMYVEANSSIATKAASGGYLYVYENYSVLSTKFTKDGTYTATPAYKYNDTWYDVHTGINSINYLTIEVTSTKVKVTSPTLASGLKVSDVTINSPFYLNGYFSIDAKLSCSEEEYLGNIKVALYNPTTGLLTTATDGIPVNVTKNEVQDINILSMFSGTTIKAGDYNLAFIDAYSNVISEYYPITLNAAVTSTAIDITGIRMADGNTTAVKQDDFTVISTITCTEGYFTDYLYCLIFPYIEGQEVRSLDGYMSTPQFIEANQSVDVSFDCDMTTTGTAGSEYFATIFKYNATSKGLTAINQNKILKFTLAEDAGIDAVVVDAIEVKMYPNPADSEINIETQSDIESIDVWSLSGAKMLGVGAVGDNNTTVDVSSLAAGNYIVTIRTADGVAAKQLIKK